MSIRKPYNNRPGYIASRHNLINGGWIVIYLAKEQKLDEAGGKYAVVCELHNTIYQTTSLPKARPLLKYPDFCEQCKAKVEEPDEQETGICNSCGSELAPIMENNGFPEPGPTKYEVVGFKPCGECKYYED